MHLFFVLIFSICVISIIPVDGQSIIQETVKIDNKTFNIIIESPTNEIIIQTDNSETERLLTIIENIHKEDKGYDNGDVLISSSTILSFLGFGSFLFIHRNNSTEHKNLPALTAIVLICVLIIVVLHLFVIVEIMLNDFSAVQYVIVIFNTMFFMAIITATMIKINFALFGLKRIPEIIGSIYPELDKILESKQKQIKIDSDIDEFQNKINDIKD